MFKIRKFLSVIVAFVVMITVFSSYSIGVKAAPISITCTIDSGGQLTNVSGPLYTNLSNQPDVNEFIVMFYITNNYSSQITVVPSSGSGTTTNISNTGINTGYYTMVFNRTSGIETQSATVIDNNSGTQLPAIITYSVDWGNDATSGGGDSSSDTSSKTSSSDTSSETSTTVSHTHSYAWEDVKEATEDDNGEMIYKCSCGEVLYRVPTSAFNVFNRNTAEKVKNAKQGATVKIETSRWISFHKMVMQALADRPDVSLEVSFLDGEYKGNRVSFTIPAGTDTLSLLDENGFSGFLYLAGKFGTAN